MDTVSQRSEGPFAVVLGGILSVVFGLVAVLLAVGAGWLAAAALGLGLLLVAWKVPVSPAAKMLRVIVAGWGVAALLGAVFAFVT